MSEFIKVTIDVESGVATVVLDRPKLNPLNRQMQNELRDAFEALGSDESVRVIVMHGNERAFAAGADVKEMIDWSLEDVQREGAELQACFSAIASTPRPIIAAVNGYALGGGCELALCADLRIAGESAQFGQPEILLGIIPGAGGTQRLRGRPGWTDRGLRGGVRRHRRHPAGGGAAGRAGDDDHLGDIILYTGRI